MELSILKVLGTRKEQGHLVSDYCYWDEGGQKDLVNSISTHLRCILYKILNIIENGERE